MDGIECLNCGHLNLADAIYCEECGVQLVRPAPKPLSEPVLEQDVAVEDALMVEMEQGSETGDFEANAFEASDLSNGHSEEPKQIDITVTFVQPLAPQGLPRQDTPELPLPRGALHETADPDLLAEDPLAEAALKQILSGSKDVDLNELEDVTGERADHLDPVSDAVDVDPNPEDPVIDPTDPADESMPLKQPPMAVPMADVGTDLEPESPKVDGIADPAAIAAPMDLDENPGTVLDMPDEPEPAPPEPKPPTAWLISEIGDRFELPMLPILYLGKPNDEIPIQVDLSKLAESEIISRVHAVIHRVSREDQPEAYYLEDAGSLNGTSLNGEPLQAGTRHRKLLQPGDTITLGRKRQINFRFQLETEEPETEALPE